MRLRYVSPDKTSARIQDKQDLLGHYGMALKQCGLRPTMPRLYVLDVFHQSVKRHLTAEDIYRALMAKCIEISLATVYRILSQLGDAGLLKRNTFDANRAYFELNDNEAHHHLLCLGCGAVHEFSNAFLDAMLHDLAHTSGYQFVLHQVAIQGYCAPCAGALKGRLMARASVPDRTS